MTEKLLQRKKLIEVALPLEAINKASAREKSIRHGHPSTLHLWWARRPLAAARAVIFAQMVDDPGNDEERQKLSDLIEELVKWENTTNEELLERAREEIRKSWRATCGENRDHPRAAELFNPDKLPAFHDPFAGGGSLPLEAQRLGLESYASDLNPVAVLINKAMIEIPPKFAGRPPVNPAAQRQKAQMDKQWRGAQGLAEDVRYYGKWMRDEAERRIGHLYPKVSAVQEKDGSWRHATPEEIRNPQSAIRNLTVIAWLWARTVKSPNPAFRHVDVPLASTFMLSTKPGKEAYVEPVIEGDSYRFTVKVGKPKDAEGAKNGTKVSRGSFRCLFSNVPIRYEYIDDEANAGCMGARLMAIVAEGARGRLYLPPTEEMEAIARGAEPTWKPDAPSRGTWASNAQGRRYGFQTFGDYFTSRQLVALTTFSDLAQEAREQVKRDALAAGLPDDGRSIDEGGNGATAYADAVAVYLAFALSRSADRGSSICSWDNSPKMEALRNTFGRQAIPMMWDFAEGNPFSESSGNWLNNVEWGVKAIYTMPSMSNGIANQADATANNISLSKVVSTDPPYCLAPGTLIQTSAGYVPIEQVQVGDRVLTHTGRFARVTRAYCRDYAGSLYRLKVAHANQPLLITGDHPIYGIRTGGCEIGYADYCHVVCAWMAQNNNHCSQRIADNYRLEWILAGEVKRNDLIFMPTLQPGQAPHSFRLEDWLPDAVYIRQADTLHYQKATARSLARREGDGAAPRQYTTPATITLTPELCRLIGYFVAEGYARVEHDGGAIQFVFHVNERNLHADVERLMKICFGLHPGKLTDNRPQNNQSVRLNFYSKPIAELLRRWCYTADSLKRLPDWALHLDTAQSGEILRGYWAGDGSCANSNYIASTNSPHLAGQMRLLLQRLGIVARLHSHTVKPTMINGKLVVARGEQYGLFVTGGSLIKLAAIVGPPKKSALKPHRGGQHGSWWEGGYLLPIRKVETVEYNGKVYNLETEDHSYTTAAGCVHNCDNIGYADLSDFFYVWLRRSLKNIFPSLFATLGTPKAEELVSSPYRHGGKKQAEQFFMDGMTRAMHRLAEQAHPAFPVTIYYAYKQAETENDSGTTSTGWESFLASVIQAGFQISGTWPIRTELSNRMIGMGTNALASSIVLVCRPRPADAKTITRREFLNQLKAELPGALADLQRGNIAPVDLAQAAIGPGMAVFTRYAKVLDAAGNAMSVREALALINQTLDEALAEQEGDFDADTRWALAWFEQSGFAEGEYGVAETLSKAKNTSVAGMVAAGILASKGGKVRMLKPDELPADWDPENDPRQNVWERTHHLVRALESGGDMAAAQLVRKLGGKAEVARELAYRLYTVCERKKRAAEALSYNALVQSWPEITRLSREKKYEQESFL